MTLYNDTVHDFEDDIHRGLKDERVLGYRDGVDRVIEFLSGWDDEGQLTRDIRDAIEEGII